MISTSLKTPAEVTLNVGGLLPQHPTANNYTQIFKDTQDPEKLKLARVVVVNDANGQQRNRLYPLQVGFQKRGRSGIEVSDWLPCLGECVDDLAVVRSLYTTDDNHGAQTQFHSGRHMLDGEFPTSLLLGLDDATLSVAPRKMLRGSLQRLRDPESVVIDQAGYVLLFPGEPLELGRILEMNDHRVTVVSISDASPSVARLPLGAILDDGKGACVFVIDPRTKELVRRQVKIAGYDALKDSLKLRQHIGYLPERVPLYEDMTVTSYLRYAGRIHGMRRQAIESRLEDLLPQCRVAEFRERMIGKLSPGQRPRVPALARQLGEFPVEIGRDGQRLAIACDELLGALALSGVVKGAGGYIVELGRISREVPIDVVVGYVFPAPCSRPAIEADGDNCAARIRFARPLVLHRHSRGCGEHPFRSASVEHHRRRRR